MKVLAVAAVLLVLAVLAWIVARRRPRKAAPQPSVEDPGQAAIERARQDVERVGWHLCGVRGTGSSGFAFTIGLWKTYRHPELLVFAPSDDPRGVMGRVSGLAKRVAQGETFETSKIYEGLFGKHSGTLRTVHAQWYPEYLGTAGGFYGSFDFPALQVYWPDPESRFPWEGGFAADWFRFQSVLYEPNLVLANVGFEAIVRTMELSGEDALRRSFGELFLAVPPEEGEAALESWRWRIGPEARLSRVSLFGDLQLSSPDGRFHWLDTGTADHGEIAAREQDLVASLCADLPRFLHASLLLQFRAMEYLPKPGEVFSWRQPLLTGGTETVDNVDVISWQVHVSNSGRFARGVKAAGPQPS